MTIPAIGVEEEYQLVDPTTGCLLPECNEVMGHLGHSEADIQHELHLTQIEMASPVCQMLEDVRRSLINTRQMLIQASGKRGLAISALGTNPMPMPDQPDITPKARYNRMTEQYQQLARDLFIFGCHVHVSVPDPSVRLEIMNRSQRWLPALQAMTANSPYWDGMDTGYASYRRELWAQWPLAGPAPHFENEHAYRSTIQAMIDVGAIADESFIYWDLRLPTKIPTLEFRVADVMTEVEHTVAFVGLVRAIVMQCHADVSAGKPHLPIPVPVLRFALWQAARYGLDGNLIDPTVRDALPAHDLLARLLDWCRPALEISGDAAIVAGFLDELRDHGNGAARQRAWAGEALDLPEVVRQSIRRTGCFR
jgi:carboxylate-amine ligase